jgi:DNA-binding response OmpR family regulator
MQRILLVEDDPGLGTGIKIFLEYEKYEVTWVQNLESARHKNQTEKFELVILDLGLPDGSGISFCEEIRAQGSRMPVIILTAQSDEESVVRGLKSGANDYMRKPFGNRELLARIQNVLRETVVRDDQIRYGDLLVLREKRRIMNGQTELELSRREFDILLYLVEHAESVVTREQLISNVDKDGEMIDRAVDSHLSHIRSKFKKNGIVSVKITPIYGIGYTLEKT